jgi:hypothetical protein
MEAERNKFVAKLPEITVLVISAVADIIIYIYF